MESIVEKTEEEKAPLSEELAEVARKWHDLPPQAAKPELQPAPGGVRSVRYDRD